MNRDLSRREFIGALAALPLAVEGALASKKTASIPIIDSHIHFFDRTRGDAPAAWGKSALPARYKALVKPFGVVGAIIVEASPRLEDNQWLLDQAQTDPIVVGAVGMLDPAAPDFGKNLDRFRKNKLYLGIRHRPGAANGLLAEALDKPGFVSNLKLLADAGLSLDTYTPQQEKDTTIALVRMTDRVSSLRVIIDHLPGARLPDERADRDAYMAGLRELSKRPHVYIKLSEVVRRVDDKVSTDLSLYREWLDELWNLFGEDHVIFGSDWPNSESVELNSYPHVIDVARAYVTGKGPGALSKVFWRNSIAAYHWIKRDSRQPQA